MRISGLVFAAAALAGGLVSTSAGAEDKQLNVYNWSDYIAEDTIARFEAETGIKVTYDVYDSNEMAEAKLLAGKSGYDIVVPSGPFIERQIKAGIYQPLQKDKIPNLKTLDPTVMSRAAVHDPGNTHAVVYMWGTNGLGINPDKVKAVAGDDAPLDSWALIFDPKWAKKVAQCGVYFMDSPAEVMPAALAYLGLDPNSTVPADYDKVEDLLMKVRPFITKFHSSEYISALANGDICVAMGYSGDVLQARARAKEAANGVTVTYAVPKEGAEIWFDMMAILADAPHPEAAHKFINFILKPEITAGITNTVWYANANAAATDLVVDAVRTDPGVYPAQATMDKLFVKQTLPQKADRLRTRLWNKVKTGH
jgi:putrescine transport system substrate-binding protein